ncbi:MAG: acyl-[acyl-carrier-protein]--UDP-N-acetylglucosamine O-acyltransferase [Epsilonproteobacteria bacterium]|nr:MAG: acyl-[acyl-carrier-protein]--UDP-N-acetylglucosamine O-acyltransferase [Campylobacterota bacterium]RLA66710.1 MAG: acyl-[acyl-carrier-protein]--UDP-N-acetylglucosamine O-acyltransferase [Campylobacterota bacterium]
MDNVIHPMSFVDSKAKLGKNVKIGPFCVVGPDVELGDNCELISHVTIDGITKIGKGNTFFPQSVIGGRPQDLTYNGEPTILEIGNNNTIRECVTIHRGTLKENGITKLGSGNYLMAYVHLGHDVVVEDNCIITNAVNIAGHVKIGSGCIIGGGTNISQFVKIGRGAYLGGSSGVDKDIPPFCTAYGNRIRLKGINIIGMKRRGIEKPLISELLDFFREMESSNLSPKSFVAKDEMSKDFSENEFVKEMSNFIVASDVGIAPFNF